MGKFRLCLEFSGKSTGFQNDASYEKAYKNIYKPLASILFTHPGLNFSFHFSGVQLEWFKRKNPEFLEMLKKLIDRKQLEIIGGGYYNPVFPLLFPLDRSGQVEELSLAIRQNLGKRPRGLSVCADSWDPSLVMSFATAGMEYVLLDSSLIPPAKQSFLPIVMTDRGKTINILPVYNDFLPSDGENALSWGQRLVDVYKASVSDKVNESDSDRCAVICFSEENISRIMQDSFLTSFLEQVSPRGDNILESSLPLTSIRMSRDFSSAYIHSGINSEIARWCYSPYEVVELTDGYPTSIYDFLNTYKSSHALYDRMIYVSLLVNQCHGDKMRKNAAREHLWAAQTGDAYVCKSSGLLVDSSERQRAYKNLTEAEKLVRECSPFKESVGAFDYNADGFKEYVCRMEKFNVCVGSQGGSIFELDVMKSSDNYADNMSRIAKYDYCDDNYFRGIFVEHLFEEEEFEKYCHGEPCRNGQFSNNRYRELGFSSQRHEIQLGTYSTFSSRKLPISLKKNYIVKSNGLSVQYILKNNSEEHLKARFASESNLTETAFLSADYVPYQIEAVSGGEIKASSSESACYTMSRDGLLHDISAVQVSDLNSNVSFMFEPNENSYLTFSPITFKRRQADAETALDADRTFCMALVWDVDLEPGMEMEKTINLSITYSRKRKK